jgi:hypothetical protein
MAGIQTTEVDARLAKVNVEPYNFVCWQIFRGWTTFKKTTFVRIQKYEHGGQQKFKIQIMFYGKIS